MKSRLVWFVTGAAALLLALVWFPGRAAAADTPISVLGMEATEGAPESVASALTDALRQQISRTRGYRLVPGRDLVEVKLVFACPDEAASCMADAAKNIGASRLIFGNVRRAGDSLLVTLKLLDAGSGKVTGYVGEQLTRGQVTTSALREPAQKWFASLTGQGGGAIRVAADVQGATISLDGLPVGTTGADPVLLSSVSAGTHEIVITKPGLEQARRTVTVVGGETAEVAVQLEAGSTAGAERGASAGAGEAGLSERVDEPGGSRGGGALLKTASWATLGASVVALGLGVKFSLDVKDTNTKLDPYRRFDCKPPQPQTRTCDKNNQFADRISSTDSRANTIEDLQSEGRKFETLQYVFYGVGGALLVTSGILFYKAYFSDAEGDERASSSPSLVVAPILHSGGGGVGALLRF